MSSNVVQLFQPKVKKNSIDTEGLVATIVDWADDQGVNIHDPAFLTRCEDLVIWLEIMAKNSVYA